MSKKFEVNSDIGELKVFTDNGYFLVQPFGEGVAVELFDNRISDGFICEGAELPSVDLVLVENYNNKISTIVWDDTSQEEPTTRIEHRIQYK